MGETRAAISGRGLRLTASTRPPVRSWSRQRARRGRHRRLSTPASRDRSLARHLWAWANRGRGVSQHCGVCQEIKRRCRRHDVPEKTTKPVNALTGVRVGAVGASPADGQEGAGPGVRVLGALVAGTAGHPKPNQRYAGIRVGSVIQKHPGADLGVGCLGCLGCLAFSSEPHASGTRQQQREHRAARHRHRAGLMALLL